MSVQQTLLVISTIFNTMLLLVLLLLVVLLSLLLEMKANKLIWNYHIIMSVHMFSTVTMRTWF